MPEFNYSDLPSLAGKTILITGGTAGLGLQSAKELARVGAKVYITARNEEKGQAAIKQIKEAVPTADVHLGILNLASLKAVVAFATWFKERETKLDVLLNNAGIWGVEFGLTADGIELQFGTNHVGPFLLTMLLLPLVLAAEPSRIVNLSSALHENSYKEIIRFEAINDAKSYNTNSAYGQSKAANVLFTLELNERLKDKKVWVNCNHPGVVATEIQGKAQLKGLMRFLVPIVIRWFAKSVEDGARTQVYLAGSKEIEEKDFRGKYFTPTAKLTPSSKATQDRALAGKLWEFTENLIKEKLGELPYPSLQSPQLL